jgi:hypothetical protein
VKDNLHDEHGERDRSRESQEGFRVVRSWGIAPAFQQHDMSSNDGAEHDSIYLEAEGVFPRQKISWLSSPTVLRPAAELALRS